MGLAVPPARGQFPPSRTGYRMCAKPERQTRYTSPCEEPSRALYLRCAFPDQARKISSKKVIICDGRHSCGDVPVRLIRLRGLTGSCTGDVACRLLAFFLVCRCSLPRLLARSCRPLMPRRRASCAPATALGRVRLQSGLLSSSGKSAARSQLSKSTPRPRLSRSTPRPRLAEARQGHDSTKARQGPSESSESLCSPAQEAAPG